MLMMTKVVDETMKVMMQALARIGGEDGVENEE